MILVVGATGQLGGTIARRLMAGGQKVRVLVRPATDAGAYGAGVCEVARGDLRDRASLDEACKGIATVVTTANSARRGGGDTVDTVDLNGTRSLIDAAKAAGVQHFVYTSVLGVTPDSPAPFLAAKAKNEAHLRASGMTWTILAPNAFMESWPAMVVGMPAMAGKPVTIVGDGQRKHTFVSERDVASFGVAAVTHPAARNRHIPIGGPEALSWRDAPPSTSGCWGIRGGPIRRTGHADSGNPRRRAALPRRAGQVRHELRRETNRRGVRRAADDAGRNRRRRACARVGSQAEASARPIVATPRRPSQGRPTCSSARSSSCIVCITGSGEPARSRCAAIWTMQPTLPMTTAAAPVEATAPAFAAPSDAAISGCSRL